MHHTCNIKGLLSVDGKVLMIVLEFAERKSDRMDRLCLLFSAFATERTAFSFATSIWFNAIVASNTDGFCYTMIVFMIDTIVHTT